MYASNFCLAHRIFCVTSSYLALSYTPKITIRDNNDNKNNNNSNNRSSSPRSTALPESVLHFGYCNSLFYFAHIYDVLNLWEEISYKTTNYKIQKKGQTLLF